MTAAAYAPHQVGDAYESFFESDAERAAFEAWHAKESGGYASDHRRTSPALLRNRLDAFRGVPPGPLPHDPTPDEWRRWRFRRRLYAGRR